MRSPSLQEKLPATRVGIYHGAEAAAAFSSLKQEFPAFTSGAALYEATWRAKILVSGQDRVRWLNGMVTNNVRDLAIDRGVYNFALNAQGRIQADLTVFQRGDYLMLVTDESQAANLAAWFDRYIIMDDVELANVSEKLASLVLQGPKAAGVLASMELPSSLEPLQIADATWQNLGVSVIRGASEARKDFEIWAAPENIPSLWDAFVSAGATPVGFEAVELARVTNGVPAFGQDIRDRDLPQETAQKHALHFAKGCYVGQEIVERIHSRGNVHRGFTGFTLSSRVEPGTKLQKDAKDVGEITSVAELPDHRWIALGYVRREANTTGAVLSAGSETATVHPLPFET